MTDSTRGIAFGKERRKRGGAPDFARNLAIVIGIDDYANDIPKLQTAVNDASQLAELLRDQLDYKVWLLTEDVTRDRLLCLLHEEVQVGEDDRVLFYFAGHGIALDGDDGPEGFLIPQDANAADPKSFLPMTELSTALNGLLCRHLLAILDCCFAGSFRWAGGTRTMPRPPEVIHKERYLRYIKYPAWQIVTFAAYDQQALDVVGGQVLGAHGEADRDAQRHSPFARALLDGLVGAADQLPNGGDGLLTATELYLFLREAVEPVPSIRPTMSRRRGSGRSSATTRASTSFASPAKTSTHRRRPN